MKNIFKDNFDYDKQYRNVRDHCHYTGKYRGSAHSICNLKYNIPKETAVVFHNASNYDYHFIMKELAKESEQTFDCLNESKGKCKTFAVSITKS